jgi:hypothetical protein
MTRGTRVLFPVHSAIAGSPLLVSQIIDEGTPATSSSMSESSSATCDDLKLLPLNEHKVTARPGAEASGLSIILSPACTAKGVTRGWDGVIDDLPAVVEISKRCLTGRLGSFRFIPFRTRFQTFARLPIRRMA